MLNCEDFFCNYSEKDCHELIHCLLEGEYQIPHFQRDFVWSKEQVAKFIDSLVRGFPTGSFVLWRTKERLQANRKIGNVDIREPKAEEHISYVLDGQQRMTALFVVYKGLQIERGRKKEHHQEKNTKKDNPKAKPQKIDDYQEIMLRLEADEDKDFCFVRDPKAETSEVAVSVYDLITQSILEIQEKYNLSLQEAKRFEEFKKHIEKYRFPIVSIDNAPLEQIVEIFARINTGGTKLTPFEVMCAKFYSPTKTDPNQNIIKQGFDLQECFENLTDDLGRLDYAFNQPMAVLQLISYLLRSNIQENLTKKISIPTILKLEPEKVQEKWEFVASCFAHAAHLLKHDLKIPSFDFLPSVGSLMLMAYFYALSKHKSPNDNQITNLKRLFFRSAFFSTKTDGDTLLKQLGLVEQIYEEKPIDFKKELPFYTITKELLVEEKINIKSYLHRGILCVLATLEPRDFDNNTKVVLDNLFLQNAHKRNLHHFFPKKHLEDIAPECNRDAIANITFLSAKLNQEIKDKPPKIYIPEFQAKNPHLQDSLKTHLIDISDPKVLESYQDFLKLRATAILDKIKELT
ncbi:DUF262 domain-containing protein [Helicobacter sp. NHP21005]|uniref:GmrSD restriction endonuclease domain-containing protein n=1 Tax=Helicobacter felistomachi TaxID=3040201 RepID=UPI002573268E|nr:DUF262 domain-containing protein [Helicobacter sp. NHP21005]BEG58034.1 DUF262 domain-containing protein [Helicobacter sp. NHP21005]